MEGLPEPKGEAAGEGENIHGEMEGYYKTGAEPTNESCRELLKDPAVPSRDIAGILAEFPADYQMNTAISGVPVKGKIDLVVPPQNGAGAIWDWKSKSPSSIKRAPKPADLAKDNQAIIYGDYYLRRYPEAETVTFTHANVLRGEGKTYKIVSSPAMDRNHIATGISALEEKLARMKAVAAAETWEEVEPNWSACRLYPPAGCPYVSTCSPSLTVKDAFTKMFAGEESTTMPPEKTETDATPLPSLLDGAFVLFIDCQPRTALPGTIFLEDEIQRRSLLVLDEARRLKVKGAEGAKDVRELEFGKGTTAITKSFLENPPTGIVVASNAGLSAQVLEVLKPWASVVVVPTR